MEVNCLFGKCDSFPPPLLFLMGLGWWGWMAVWFLLLGLFLGPAVGACQNHPSSLISCTQDGLFEEDSHQWRTLSRCSKKKSAPFQSPREKCAERKPCQVTRYRELKVCRCQFISLYGVNWHLILLVLTLFIPLSVLIILTEFDPKWLQVLYVLIPVNKHWITRKVLSWLFVCVTECFWLQSTNNYFACLPKTPTHLSRLMV